MELLRLEQVKKLSEQRGEFCVSIYLPTDRAGVEVKQGAIRLKNLLKQAEQELASFGMRTPEIRKLLEPVHELAENAGFWQYQADGLAIFRSPERFGYYRLPLKFQELVVVSDRFHVKPLLRLFTEDGRFYLLTLRKNEIHFFLCSRFGLRELELPATTPKSLQDYRRIVGVQKQEVVHKEGAPLAYHGHGERAEDDKEELRDFFRYIDKGVHELLRSETAPLVLAAVDYYVPIYREVNSYPHLAEAAVTGSPVGRRPEELQEEAWRLLEPHFRQQRAKAAARFQELAGSPRTSNDVRAIVPAAYNGKVEELFVAVDEQIWGHFNPDTQEVHIHEQRQIGDADLLDFAAIQTLVHRGRVFAVSPGEVPGGNHVAAIFRY